VYKDVAHTCIKPAAYADDHMHALSIHRPADIVGTLQVYTRYTIVSGLQVNPSKTELLAINTAPDTIQIITELTGITPVQHLTLLGIKLAHTYEEVSRPRMHT
jgi:hypothetical protein